MINRITNANAYREGNSLIGRLDNIELPAIKSTTEDVKALGLYSTIELPTGLDKLEAKLAWNAMYATDWKAASMVSTQTVIVKSNMTSRNATGQNSQIPVTATIKGTYKELPSGNIKAGEKADGMEHLMSVTYYKLEIDGVRIYEVDVFNNIFFQADTDILESFRNNQ